MHGFGNESYSMRQVSPVECGRRFEDRLPHLFVTTLL